MHILSNYWISPVRAACVSQFKRRYKTEKKNTLRSENFPSIFMMLTRASNKIFIEINTLYYLVDRIAFIGWLLFKDIFLGCLFGFCVFWCCYGFGGLFQGIRVVWFVCWSFLNSYCISSQGFPMSCGLQWIVFSNVLILYASSPRKFKSGQK